MKGNFFKIKKQVDWRKPSNGNISWNDSKYVMECTPGGLSLLHNILRSVEWTQFEIRRPIKCKSRSDYWSIE